MSLISISSINKAVNDAKINGSLNLKIVNLYNIYLYYINFTNNKVEFININKELKENISKLKYKFPNILCNYKLSIDNIINNNNLEKNIPPTISDNIIDIKGISTYMFKISDFTKNYKSAFKSD